MKTSILSTIALIFNIAANAQKLQGDNTFISTTNQSISVNDTVKIGFPAAGQQSYLFIENKKNKAIKKAGKISDGLGKVSSLFGLSGIRGAVTGLKVGQAANSAHSAADVADLANGNGIIKPEQKIVITKLYQDNDKEFFADAVNQKNTTYKIKINQALMVKEIVPNGVNIYTDENK